MKELLAAAKAVVVDFDDGGKDASLLCGGVIESLRAAIEREEAARPEPPTFENLMELWFEVVGYEYASKTEAMRWVYEKMLTAPPTSARPQAGAPDFWVKMRPHLTKEGEYIEAVWKGDDPDRDSFAIPLYTAPPPSADGEEVRLLREVESVLRETSKTDSEAIQELGLLPEIACQVDNRLLIKAQTALNNLDAHRRAAGEGK